MDIQILAADEPSPVNVINEDADTPFVFLCDHATSFIPKSRKNLGVEDHHLTRHVAYDIGIKGVTEGLAEHFKSRAIFSNFSRLLVDPNRKLDNDGLMPVVSDGCHVPANQDMPTAEREARLNTFYWPYHNQIEATLDGMIEQGQVPIVVSMHSMTHEMAGVARPWPVCVLWNQDPRIPLPLIETFTRQGFTCGDNVPYSGRDDHGHTMERHADRRGLPNVLIEIRQDLISDQAGIDQWTAHMINAFEEVLHCPSLKEIKCYL
ncbi:N-formylglutamate amidohydrolase [Kiloniella sp. EL199]|uniref:N-formylglutamate amidohydrolase n=1 Tax=Kiloniella sp. EL199 TaxID=2107581 RepID=UPI000EA03B57|nr:N-formylglutamate amidohydrolase [Kiloniella sp. EL199]